MMTRQEAEAIYDAGKETVVRVLLDMDRRIHALERQVQDLTARLDASEQRVRQLEEQVAKDSHNSHKPPSSDGLSKPKPKSLRPKSERPTGGQPGHPGHTLRMVEKPDRIVPHRVERCSGCGRSLAEQKPDRVERRQVHDLPEPKLEVTEHQAEVKTCPCGCVNRAAFPPEAAAPVQYGPRVKSVGVYLGEYQLLPFDRLAEIMRDLFACESFSEGTLANFKADCSRRLEPVEAAIRDLAAAAPVAGFDETGVRATGSLHWLHTVSTRLLTWYYAHKRRGCEAMDAAGILADYRGRAVHDFWKSYFDYDCDHALCNGHLLRPEPGRSCARPETQGPPQAKQGVQPARPLPRPSQRNPCLHARLRGSIRQQSVGARSTDDEAAPEDIRHLPQLPGPRELLPHPRLRLHRPQERRQRAGCVAARVPRQPVRPDAQYLMIRAYTPESSNPPNPLS